MRSRTQGSCPAGKTRPQGRQYRNLLSDRVMWKALSTLRPFPNNPRIHPRDQIERLMRNIEQGWTNPILVDEGSMILAGHGRLEAAKRLGMPEVPTLTLSLAAMFN